MKNKILLTAGLIAGLVIAISASVIAGQVTLPNSFTAGTPAVASQVNANFNAVANAVNDNAVRLTTLEANVTGGNLVLAPSTAAGGNILKGTDPFIHNFGLSNTFIGQNAGNFTMTGFSNTASGVNALQSNTTGGGNTASGVSALQSNTTGNANTASGVNALLRNTTGGRNTASGVSALFANTMGNNNTASGRDALSNNTIGSDNTASGVEALLSNTTGNRNIAIGVGAGFNLTTGDNNIAIDNRAVAGESNTIRIGDNQTRAFIAGIRGVTTATAAIPVLVGTDGQLGTASSSRRLKDDIADMGEASNVLTRLRPVTFHYKSDKNPTGRTLQYGLIAEEVQKVAPGLVARSANGEIETVYYQFLAPMLLNEYQKQQRTIEAQSARMAELEHDRRAQAARIETLVHQVAQMSVVLGRLSLGDD